MRIAVVVDGGGGGFSLGTFTQLNGLNGCSKPFAHQTFSY